MKTVDFSDTIAASDLKVGRSRHLIEFIITKTSLCNEDPLTPHFYIVKLGFTGV